MLIFIIGCIIWALQIFFLQNYYESLKISENEAMVKKINQSYKNIFKGAEPTEATRKEFFQEVQNLTSGDDIFVQLDRPDIASYTSSPQLEIYKSEIEKAKLLLEDSKEETGVSLVLSGTKTKRQTWVYAGYLNKKNNSLMYIVSPLYPVASTLKIVKQLLVYALILSFIVSLIFAFYTAYRISKPIQRLSEQAKKLAIGEYGIVFKDDFQFYEMNNLATSLNRASLEIDKSLELQKDLIANISHDLKTPLTMVKSYAEMIRDLSGDVPEKRNAHLQVIIEESDRLNTLVNDILTLSAVQSGTLHLNITAFSIAELFESVILPYKILEEKDGYKIMFNCRQDAMVLGDEGRIKQVVSNLLSNAVKYCGVDKEIFVNVKCWGKRVHCEIVDHGQGIAPDELEHIWDRYIKSSTNHVRNTKGSGIGLSIVKEILHAHNARCGVESKVGRGTTFWFELEVAENEK